MIPSRYLGEIVVCMIQLVFYFLSKLRFLIHVEALFVPFPPLNMPLNPYFP